MNQPGPNRSRPRFSLIGLLLVVSLAGVSLAYAVTLRRLRVAEAELTRLRQETGYLEPTGDDTVAAVRLTSDQPMTYRLRVRVPSAPRYRLAYSSVWPHAESGPSWFAAVPMPPGESVVIVRILKDPRDERWKITALRRGEDGTRRIATALPGQHVDVFTGSHDWLRSGIPRDQTTTAAAGQALRVLDERVLVGEGAMMLYGDAPPDDDMIGVFAELQPDVGPL
jgi:hypothetical protein